MCVNTNYSLKQYVKQPQDLNALKNRITSLYFWIKIEKTKPAKQSQLPHLVKSNTQFGGEALLALYYKYFGKDLLNLPPYDESIPIQELPFDPEEHLNQ